MNIVIKDKEDFRLILKKEPCIAPVGLYNIEMIQEQLKDGEITQTSTYQFFMSKNEISILTKALAQ
jgi:hypothetical protein